MDYQSEQEMEIEALQAILMDDIQEYGGSTPSGWGPNTMYKVVMTPLEDGEEQQDDTLRLEFLFQHTAEYPDEVPNIRLRSLFGLNDDEVAEVQSVCTESMEDHMGMAMVFSLIEVAKEWLRSKANVSDDNIKGLTAEEIQKQKEEEEEEERRAHRSMGTPVTPETFAAWKEKFDKEMALLKAQQEEEIKTDIKAAVLGAVTGKQWFMSQDRMGRKESSEDEDFFDDVEEDEEELGDEEDLVDYEDDDDDGMLDQYLASKDGVAT
ncbi:hypothetical protein BSKO_13867 [Bryopsis sp. KO-2023]|nr:hypothetical protein BSKO_13867 [Bryopsis sp. KO-2023]